MPPAMGSVVVRTPRSMAAPPGKRMTASMPTQLTAARQNATEIVMRPAIFCDGVRPSERLWATDSMSSSRPREPVASVASTATMRSGVHLARSATVSTTPARMMTPPMVGVPCLTRWLCGPSARICWPMPSFLSSRMKGGMARPVTMAATAMAMNTWYVGYAGLPII